MSKSILPLAATMLAPVLLATALAACGNASEPAAAPGAEAPAQSTEKWTGKVEDWEISIEVASTEVGGTRFQSGTIKSSRPDCLARGTVDGNTNGKNGVTWVAVGDNDLELVIEGVRKGDIIEGTVESREGPAGCSLGRKPITWRLAA